MNPGLFRLFLATLVVIHHSFPLRLGALAVGMFFVLSGFWVTRMWRSSYSKLPRPLFAFYASRWWRLAPLFVVVQLMCLLTLLNKEPASWPEAIGDPRWWITQVSVLGSTQFGRILPPAWSLDVESQFYLVAPWVVMLFSSFAARVVNAQANPIDGSIVRRTCLFLAFVVLALLGWSATALLGGVSMEAPRLDLYAWLFFVGMLCEFSNWIPSRNLVAFSAISFSLLTTAMLSFPMTRSAIWVAGASGEGDRNLGVLYYFVATVVAIPAAISTVHRKSSPTDMWLGDLSYPLYLFHWMPRDWYYAHFDLGKGYARNVPFLLANFAMAFGGAIVLLQVVDRPVQKLRKRWLRGARSARRVVVAK